MSVQLRVPEVGESITEVQIGAWLKTEGDRFERDEPLVEIESDKATLELPAPVAGTLSKVLQPKGAFVRVGDVIAELTEGRAAGDGAPAPRKPAAAPAAGAASRHKMEQEWLLAAALPAPRAGKRRAGSART